MYNHSVTVHIIQHNCTLVFSVILKEIFPLHTHTFLIEWIIYSIICTLLEGHDQGDFNKMIV